MTVVSMSRDELDRVQVLRDVVLERIAVAEAAQLLRLTRRQVFRLLRRYHERGASGLVSQKRGKPSNRSYPAVVRTQALALIRANYPDFGPTFASQMLLERHGLSVSGETLRKWMGEEGLWLSRKRRRQFHQPRLRRDHFGGLVQIDGSEHHWLEDRGPR